jgi:hydrogenase maturation protein HypF
MPFGVNYFKYGLGLEALIERKKILITGRVQGVGFRPAVYRIARSLGLTGAVRNDTKGVTIEVQGDEDGIAEFLRRIQSPTDKPPLAKIDCLSASNLPIVAEQCEFVIEASDSEGAALAQVSADVATCADCLREMNDKEDFRCHYPFINCTNCGPRYSIVRTIPYDRPNTTMSVFAMCRRCAAEYDDISDRRFHAQPVACPSCGPGIWLTDNHGRTLLTQTEAVIAQAAQLLRQGRILAIKGVGGFHLAVNAFDDEAVKRLRARKRRDHKPFALMTDSLAKIQPHSVVSASAEQVLKSPQSPIVLLPKRQGSSIAQSVAPGVDTFGFMLCYAPLQHLLFAQGLDVLVMTSGNISDEPLITDNEQAIARLGDIADAFLMHDRDIYRRVDDSIVHFIADQPVLLRRARGYVPTPIMLEQSCRRDIFAAGADLKNTFCLVKQNQLICSEHIGDLEDAEVYQHYVGSIEHLRTLFEVKPDIAVCDLHPGYLSTQYALSLPSVQILQVQHHWAHIASVLAEYGLPGPVIGLACDGTGYGSDGAIWGCECLIASLTDFSRFGHLAYYPLAGGDKASKEAIRPALSLLQQAFAEDFELTEFQWLLERFQLGAPDSRLQTPDSRLILEQLAKRINTMETSSLGRVFDAVAAILGLGSHNHFEAQLPMVLEAVVEPGIEDKYGFELACSENQVIQLDIRPMIQELVADVRRDLPMGVVAAKFHNCMAEALFEMAKAAREKTRLQTVALSGGVFCNRYLTNRLIGLLRKNGFEVLFNREVPSNDGGISLGQAAIAAAVGSR